MRFKTINICIICHAKSRNEADQLNFRSIWSFQADQLNFRSIWSFQGDQVNLWSIWSFQADQLSLLSIWNFQADQLNLKFPSRPSLYVVFKPTKWGYGQFEVFKLTNWVYGQFVVFKSTKWVYGQFDFFLTDQVYLKFSSLVYYTQSCLYHVNIILSHIIWYLNMK